MSEGWIDLQCLWQWWCSWITNPVAHENEWQMTILFISWNVMNEFPGPNEWEMNWSSILLTMMMLLNPQYGFSWNEWQLTIMLMSFNAINTLPGPNEWGMNWSSILLTMVMLLNHQSDCSWNEWQLIIMFMSFNIINVFPEFQTSEGWIDLQCLW